MTTTFDAIHCEKDYRDLVIQIQSLMQQYTDLKQARETCSAYLHRNAATQVLATLSTSSHFLSDQFPDVTASWSTLDLRFHRSVATELQYMALDTLKKRCIQDGTFHPCVNEYVLAHTPVKPKGFDATTHKTLMHGVSCTLLNHFYFIRDAVVNLQKWEKTQSRQSIYGTFKKPVTSGNEEVKKLIDTTMDKITSSAFVDQVVYAKDRVTQAVNQLLAVLPDHRLKALQYGKILGKIDEMIAINKVCRNYARRLVERQWSVSELRSSINRQHYDNVSPVLYLRRELACMVIDSHRVGMSDTLFSDVIRHACDFDVNNDSSDMSYGSQADGPEKIDTDDTLDDVPQHLIEKALYGHESIEEPSSEELLVKLDENAHLPAILRPKPTIQIKKKRTIPNETLHR